MRLITETSEQKHPVLIVDEGESRAALQLERNLRKNEDIEVLMTKEFPARLEHFFLIYAFNAEFKPEWKKQLHKNSKLILVFIKHPRRAKELVRNLKHEDIDNVKVVSLNDDVLDKAGLEQLLWFSFAITDEPFLEISSQLASDEPDPLKEKNMRVRRRFKRHYILGTIITLLVYGLITTLILLGASVMYLNTFITKPDRQTNVLAKQTAQALNKFGSVLYRPLRPVFFFFNAGLLPDTLSDMNAQLDALSASTESIRSSSMAIVADFFAAQKNPQQKKILNDQISVLQNNIAKSIELSSFLEQKIPKWNDTTEAVRLAISTERNTLERLRPLPAFLPSVLARGTHRKYLLLLADTSSAKPGGGTVPYYGVMTIDDMNIQSLNIYDAKQLDDARVIPIEATSTFKSLPGFSTFTLQNSLLSADFSDNYRQIAGLLDRETGSSGFDGAFLITDTGMQEIISAYSPVYVPETKETITPENYLIKYQIAPDKRLFIGALANQLRQRIVRSPSDLLVPALVNAFNEKQIVFLPEQSDIADTFDKLYWSGTVPTPHCIIQSFGCTIDYIFPLQANIGDKPVNRYIEKSMSQRISIDASGKISNTFSMQVHNTSLAEIFPGGTYESYMQIILPASSTVKRVTINGTAVDHPDVVNSTYTILGFPFQLNAQTTKEIKVEYDLKDTFPKSKSIYQLIFQKQIGSPNSDIALEIALPQGATITNKNISAVVKNGHVFYNTVLNADKLFILEVDNSHT